MLVDFEGNPIVSDQGDVSVAAEYKRMMISMGIAQKEHEARCSIPIASESKKDAEETKAGPKSSANASRRGTKKRRRKKSKDPKKGELEKSIDSSFAGLLDSNRAAIKQEAEFRSNKQMQLPVDLLDFAAFSDSPVYFPIYNMNIFEAQGDATSGFIKKGSFADSMKKLQGAKLGYYLSYDSGVMHKASADANASLKTREDRGAAGILLKEKPGHLEYLSIGSGLDRTKILSQYRDPSTTSTDGIYPGVGAFLVFDSQDSVNETSVQSPSYFSTICNTKLMSSAVPFLDIKVINSIPQSNADNNFKSTESFSTFPMSMELFLDQGVVRKNPSIGVTTIGEFHSGDKINVATSGMEIFTSPQTLTNPKRKISRNDTKDTMRPFLSVIDLSIDVVGLGAGVLSFKLAKLKLKLHDRTNLRLIGNLISPDMYDSVRFEIDYGYSLNVNKYSSKAEHYINNMRMKETFQVANSAYTVSESEVDIDLTLVSLGSTSVDEVDLSMPPGSGPSYEDLVKLLYEARKTILGLPNFADLKVPTVISGEGYHKFMSFTDKEIQEILSFSKKLRNQGEDGIEAAKKLVTMFQDENKRKKKKLGTARKKTQDILKSIKERLSKAPTKDNPDPFLHKQYFPLKADGKKIKSGSTTQRSHKQYISLGHLLMSMIAPHLHKQGGGTEVLFVFGCCNKNAGASFVENLASFPLERKKVLDVLVNNKDALFKQNKKISIRKFVTAVANSLVADINSVGYFGKDYKSYENRTKKEAQLRRIYSTTAPLKSQADLTPISLGMKLDSGPMVNTESNVPGAKDPDRKLTRITFYDNAHNPKQSVSKILSGLSSGKITFPYKNEGERKFAPRHFKASLEQIQSFNFALKPDLNNKSETDLPAYVVTRTEDAPESVKDHIRTISPTLDYATENSCIIKADLSLETDADLLSMRLTNTNTDAATTAPVDIPLTVMPGSLKIETFGCNHFAIGQQYFIDFGTDTTLDGYYGVTSISHSLSNGKFLTSVGLQPTGTQPHYSSINSLARSLKTTPDVIVEGDAGQKNQHIGASAIG